MPVTLNKKFIKHRLIAADMTARDLAVVAGLHETTLYRLMNGGRFHSDTLGKIAEALHCSPIDLIDTTGYTDLHLEAPTAQV